MALIWLDRALETTTTAGTGALSLGGAVSGYQAIGNIGNGNTCYYTLMGVDGNGNPNGVWESGIGTYQSAGNTLARTAVHANSSGTTSPLNLVAGNKRVVIVPGANYFDNLPAIGGKVAGGTPGRVLYVGSGPVLAESANLTFDGMHLTVGGYYLTGNTHVGVGSSLTFTTGTGHVAVGRGLTCNSTDDSLNFGISNSVTSRVSGAFGRGCTVSGFAQNFAMGNSANATSTGGTSFAAGANVTASGARSVVLGYDTTVAHRGVGVGEFANTDAAGDVVFGVAGATPFVKLKSNSSTTNGSLVAGLRSGWGDQTHATRSGWLELGAYYTATYQPGVRAEANSGGVRLGFYGVTPATRQLLATGAGATVDQVIQALQNLGLVRQS